MIRNLLPIDLPALLMLNGKMATNEARTRERLGKVEGSPISLRNLLEHYLSFRSKRHTLVSVHGGRIQGLVSARWRSGPSAWEIDCLVLVSGGESLCLSLLEKMSRRSVKFGVQRIFLRLPTESPLVPPVQQGGFSQYLTEALYKLDEESTIEVEAQISPLRPKSSEDEHELFRLYNAVVPLRVRSVEGMTLHEWQDSREGGPKREYVLEHEGKLSGWVKTMTPGREGHLDLLVHPAAAENLEALLQSSLVILRGRHPLFCVVPDFQERLGHFLVEHNFREIAEYCLLAKQLTTRLREPELMPLRA